MPSITSVSGDARPIGPASPGLIRHTAFQGEGAHVLHAEGKPGTVTAWHHHGGHNVFGYVVFLRGSGPLVVNTDGPQPD